MIHDTMESIRIDLSNIERINKIRTKSMIQQILSEGGGDWCMWCDNCSDWVTEVIPDGNEVLCAGTGGTCRNRLLFKRPEKTQKEKRISLAKAIWGL